MNPRSAAIASIFLFVVWGLFNALLVSANWVSEPWFRPGLYSIGGASFALVSGGLGLFSRVKGKDNLDSKIRGMALIPIIGAVSFLAYLVITASGSLIRISHTSAPRRLLDAISMAQKVEVRFPEQRESAFYTLSPSDWSEFQSILLDHHLTNEVQAMCHEPNLEIRFIGGGDFIVSGTLSLECCSIHIRDEFNRIEFVTIIDPKEVPSFSLPRIVDFLDDLALDSK